MADINFNPNTVKADKWTPDDSGNSSWWNTAKNQLEQAGKSATSQEIAKLAEEIKNYTMEKNTAVAERDGQLAAGDTIFVPLEYAMEEITASVEENTGKCAELQGSLDSANTALSGAIQNVSAKYSRYQNVMNEYNSADDNHKAQLESMLGSAKRAYDEAVKEQEAKQQELEATAQELEDAKKNVESLKSELEELKAEYQEEKDNYEKELGELDSKIEALNGQITESQNKLESAKAVQEQAQAQQPDAAAQNAPATEQNGKLAQSKAPENDDKDEESAQTDKDTDAFGNLYELPEGANVSVVDGVPTFTDEESGNVYKQNPRTGRWDLAGQASTPEAYEVPEGSLFELPEDASVTVIDGIPTYIADDGTKYQQNPNGLWIPSETEETAPVEYNIPEGSLSAPPAGSNITVIDGVVTCVTEDGKTYEQNPETGMWDPAGNQTPDQVYEVPDGALFELPEGAHVGIIDGTPTFVSDDGTTYVQNPDGLWVPYGPHAHNEAYEVPEGAMFELPEGASPTIENGVPTYVAEDGTKYQQNPDGLWVPSGHTESVHYPIEEAKIKQQIDNMRYVFDEQSPIYDVGVANYFKDNDIDLEIMYKKKLETKDVDTATTEMNNYISNMGNYLNKKSEAETKRNELTSKDLTPTQELALQTEYGKNNVSEAMTKYQPVDTMKGYDGSSAWDKQMSDALDFYDKLSSEADGIKDSIDIDAKVKNLDESSQKQVGELAGLYDDFVANHYDGALTSDKIKLKNQAESVLRNYMYGEITEYNIQSVLNALRAVCNS